MKVQELMDKLSGVSPDAEIIGGIWNGEVNTYTVLDRCLVVPYDEVFTDFYGTPGAFDHRLAKIESPEVVYLGSSFGDTLQQG